MSKRKRVQRKSVEVRLYEKKMELANSIAGERNIKPWKALRDVELRLQVAMLERQGK